MFRNLNVGMHPVAFQTNVHLENGGGEERVCAGLCPGEF